MSLNEEDELCDLEDDDDQEAQGDVYLRMKEREKQDDLLRILSNSLAMNERSKEALMVTEESFHKPLPAPPKPMPRLSGEPSPRKHIEVIKKSPKKEYVKKIHNCPACIAKAEREREAAEIARHSPYRRARSSSRSRLSRSKRSGEASRSRKISKLNSPVSKFGQSPRSLHPELSVKTRQEVVSPLLIQQTSPSAMN